MTTIYQFQDIPYRIRRRFSQRVIEDADNCFVGIELLGETYYFPLTKRFRRLFDIHVERKHLYHSRDLTIEDWIRDIIQAVRWQLFDDATGTVIEEMRGDISKFFDAMFANPISRAARGRMGKKMKLITSGNPLRIKP